MNKAQIKCISYYSR